MSHSWCEAGGHWMLFQIVLCSAAFRFGSVQQLICGSCHNKYNIRSNTAYSVEHFNCNKTLEHFGKSFITAWRLLLINSLCLLQRYLPAVTHDKHLLLQTLHCICKFVPLFIFSKVVVSECDAVAHVKLCEWFCERRSPWMMGSSVLCLLPYSLIMCDRLIRYLQPELFFPHPLPSFSMEHPISRQHLEANVTAPDGQMSHVLLSSCLRELG